MQQRILWLTGIALVLGAASAQGAVSVKQVMRGWKGDLARAEQMVAGRNAVNRPEMTRILSDFTTNAQTIASRITSARGADIKARFQTFAAASETAAGELDAKDKLRASLGDLRTQCRSCHHRYAN